MLAYMTKNRVHASVRVPERALTLEGGLESLTVSNFDKMATATLGADGIISATKREQLSSNSCCHTGSQAEKAITLCSYGN